MSITKVLAALMVLLIASALSSLAGNAAVADERDDKLNQIHRDRDDAVKFLLKVAASPPEGSNSERAKTEAIQLMGRLRVASAARFLVDEIEYTSFWSRAHSESARLGGFAAAKSLAEIGEPAFAAIFLRSSKPLTEKQMRLIVFVINSIYGDDHPEIAQFRLQHEIDALKKNPAVGETDLRIANLTKLLKLFNSTDFQDPQTWPWTRYGLPPRVNRNPSPGDR